MILKILYLFLFMYNVKSICCQSEVNMLRRQSRPLLGGHLWLSTILVYIAT